MINDGAEVWHDDTCEGGDQTRHLNPPFRLIQDHNQPRPQLFRSTVRGELGFCNLFYEIAMGGSDARGYHNQN